MAIARLYIMHAAEDKGPALKAALGALAEHVRPIGGCHGVELLQDAENERRFVFIEKWDSIEAHKAAGAQLSKEIMGPVMGAIDGRPDGSYCDYVLAI
jgi:quinol monooxygenase YgiN